MTKTTRYLAATATALISFMNLPFGLEEGTVLGWLVTILGAVGLVVAVALVRNDSWAPRAAVAVGGINLAGAVAAMAGSQEGALLGLVVSAAVIVLAALSLRRPMAVR